MSAVTYESVDCVAIVTIDQPEKRNALSREVVNELAEAWRRFAASSDRVAVLTASGDKAFTVGADLNDIPHDLWRGVPGVGIEIDKPIIGAVAGWVVGGGLVLANQCDLLVAADNSTFLYPEAKVGFSGGLISSLAARIPHKVAMEVLLVGEALSVQRAYEIGFVNKILPVGQQRQGALDYAHKIVANAPLVVQLLKRFVDRTLPKGPSEMAGLARREIDAVTASADAAEGLAAFRGKRPPTFEGV
ncbi:MAG: enoyl-CoA hydratase-related protein [Rhodoplanes sp.]